MTEQPDVEVLTDLPEFAGDQASADAEEVEPDEPDTGEELEEGEEPGGAADVPDPYVDFDEPQDDEATEG
jgi:hypothetical protein